MPTLFIRAIALLALASVVAMPTTPAQAVQAVPADLVSELSPVIERARQRFEARDAGGVLAYVSDQYLSGGLRKADLRQQLLTMFTLYEALQARVNIDSVRSVEGGCGSTRAARCRVAYR